MTGLGAGAGEARRERILLAFLQTMDAGEALEAAIRAERFVVAGVDRIPPIPDKPKTMNEHRRRLGLPELECGI